MTTSMNEQIHFLLKICLSHFIFERVLFLVCERWVGDGDRLLHTDTSSSDHSSTSFSSWLGLLKRGSLRAQSRWLSFQHLVPNWLQLQLTQAVCVLVIFLFGAHLLPLFFRLFTQVHLLIDGSVEGQYVTLVRSYKLRLKGPQRLFKVVGWLVSLFNGISIFERYLTPKPYL